MTDTAKKNELIVQFIKELDAIESSMTDLREQRKELKQSYKDDPDLESSDVKAAMKAYRMWKRDEDMDDLQEKMDLLSENFS